MNKYCVYVIHADNGEVKIGVSGAPFSRLSQIKREYGKKRGFSNAYIVGYFPTDIPLEIEQFAIDMLLDSATGGEWFLVHPMIAIGAVIESAALLGAKVLVHMVGDQSNPEKPTRILLSPTRDAL